MHSSQSLAYALIGMRPFIQCPVLIHFAYSFMSDEADLQPNYNVASNGSTGAFPDTNNSLSGRLLTITDDERI
jgi:hypothetical protein